MNHEKIGLEIEEKLNKLGDETSTEQGIWRAIYYDSDTTGKKLIKEYMTEAGLEIREDEIGNVIGSWHGKGNTDGKRILIGSHIDTVKNGGKYDGAAGIVTAIAAVRALKEQGFSPKYTVDIVAIEEEEGSRFPLAYIGSRSILGKIQPDELEYEDIDGISLRTAMEAAGYNPDDIVHDKPEDIKEYIELHIEQGIYLDRENIDIGIVENIVGLYVFEVTIKGEQNHAGTTPMNMRKDPMTAAAKWISETKDKLMELSKSMTFTIGDFNVKPGVSNVIPSEVWFTIDLRDGNKEILDRGASAVKETLNSLEKDGFSVEILCPCSESPESCDREMKEDLEKAVQELEYSYRKINSGAGHDAQIFASQVPTAMIFIPSVNGISHSPLEYTKAENLGKGCISLMELIKKRSIL